jgi:hypothetical protein
MISHLLASRISGKAAFIITEACSYSYEAPGWDILEFRAIEAKFQR